MYEKVKEAIIQLPNVMRVEDFDHTKGLPEELFIFSTTLVTIVNIDLFVTNEKHRILLTWREDICHGRGWQILSGCVRMRG